MIIVYMHVCICMYARCVYAFIRGGYFVRLRLAHRGMSQCANSAANKFEAFQRLLAAACTCTHRYIS